MGFEDNVNTMLELCLTSLSRPARVCIFETVYGPFLARTDKFKPESMVSIFWDYCMIMFGPFLKQFKAHFYGVFIFRDPARAMFGPARLLGFVRFS